MSEYTVCEQDYKDKDVIIDTIKELGYPVEIGESLNLYGYQGDKRPEQADIVIRRKHVGSASNDIGFTRRSTGGYDLVISEYDRGYVGRKFLEEFPKLYSQNVTVKQLKKKGYKLKKKTVDNDGSIELRFS